MPNPIINPAWGPDLAFTVTNSDFLAVDVRLSELDEEPAQIELTVPAGGRVRVLRDPGAWNGAGTEILGAAGWVAGPIALGNWSVTVAAGAAVTDPATVSVNNADGLGPSGLLRLLFRSLGVAASQVAPAGGTLSIDRLLANPSITNVQVASGLPVRELAAVQLTATAQAKQEVNPAPAVPLPALPTLVSQWAPEPANPVALTDFASVGTTATFTAPGVYDTTNLSFRLTAGYDLDANASIDPSEPHNDHVLPLAVETVTHGMVLVLDRSGSMGSALPGGTTSKWDATVQAAHAWLDLFRTFRTGESHKAGIVTFEHDTCQWALSTASDVTLRNPQNGADIAGLTINSLDTFGDVTTLNLGPVQSCTPIGDGLVRALEVLGASLSPGNVGSVILLTDGFENSGNATIKLAAGPAATTFAAARVTPALSFGNDLMGNRLFTIGVGETVDADRLNDLPNPAIADPEPGVAYYRLTTDVKQLLPTFAEMLGRVVHADPVSPVAGVVDPDAPPNAMYFDVSTGEQRVALLAPWPSATHNLRVGFRNQGAAGSFTIVSGLDPAVIGYFRRQSHGIMTIDLTVATGNPQPPATTWRVQHLDAANVAQPLTNDDVLCMVDLVTKADIRFDKPQYFIGDQIRFTCRIRSGGARVTGATVGVDAARPGEGMGTFLATNSGLILQRNPDTGTTTIGLPPGATVPKSPDPDQGKGLMFKLLLRAKEIDGLPVVTPPQFHLHDDGAHGDGAANDGDYSNVFTDTVKEGTYTFRFRVNGTLADGSRFSRLFVRSTWVGVRADPVATTVTWTTMSAPPPGMVGYVMRLTPRSASGEFLGPFRTDVIRLRVSQGTLDGPLVDNLDGSYDQRVLSRRGEDPIVNVDVYDTPIKPTGPGLDDTSCLRLWIRAIRCTLMKIWRLLFGPHH